MNIIRRAIIAAAGAALLFGAGFGAANAADPNTLQQIKNRGQINVGMLVDFPPFGLLSTTGQPEGYDADVAQALGKYLGVKTNLVPVTGPNRIPYLLSGKVDTLVASLGITPERAQKVDFSQPYAAISISVYGDKNLDISNPSDLAGKTIGVARASTQDTAITKVAPPSATIRRFDDDASAIQALLSGQVQLLGASNIVIAQLNKIAPGRFNTKFDLSSQVQGIAVRPGDNQLLASINAFLTQAKQNGTLEQIHQKWLGAPLPDVVKNSGPEATAKAAQSATPGRAAGGANGQNAGTQ